MLVVSTLAQSLKRLPADDARRLIVAFSGGLDSSVLLHALLALKPASPIIAYHVNHGLQGAASDFESQVTSFCQELGVPLQVHRVAVDPDTGSGPEAAAREARYALFESLLQPGDCLLSAHHRDDQAETLLLNLLRASGPRGLSGVPERRPLGQGSVLRPLLEVPRASLLSYATERGVRWIDDPSNADTRFDRNFLRQNVLPMLESRFPSSADRLARSATLQQDAQDILDDVAATDLISVGGDPSRLSIEALTRLSSPRQSNLLRACVRQLKLGEPGFARMQTILEQLLLAKEDAQPLVQWEHGEARRYRHHVYLLSRSDQSALADTDMHVDASVDLGTDGRFCLKSSATIGISPEFCRGALRIRYRVGGERLRPVGDAHTRTLKSLLQAHGIVPWMRDRLPLLYLDDQLLAVADLWLAEDFCAPNGLKPVWLDKPRLR